MESDLIAKTENSLKSDIGRPYLGWRSLQGRAIQFPKADWDRLNYVDGLLKSAEWINKAVIAGDSHSHFGRKHTTKTKKARSLRGCHESRLVILSVTALGEALSKARHLNFGLHPLRYWSNTPLGGLAAYCRNDWRTLGGVLNTLLFWSRLSMQNREYLIYTI